MTTSQSPVEILRKQATIVARSMKDAESGKLRGGKVSEARAHSDRIVGGIVMDDKVITIELSWETIRASTEEALVEMILKQMQGKKNDA